MCEWKTNRTHGNNAHVSHNMVAQLTVLLLLDAHRANRNTLSEMAKRFSTALDGVVQTESRKIKISVSAPPLLVWRCQLPLVIEPLSSAVSAIMTQESTFFYSVRQSIQSRCFASGSGATYWRIFLTLKQRFQPARSASAIQSTMLSSLLFVLNVLRIFVMYVFPLPPAGQSYR